MCREIERVCVCKDRERGVYVERYRESVYVDCREIERVCM